MLSRVTGSVLVIMGVRNDLPTETQSKINIGLNLKFNKKNQEVSGYTRRCKVTNTWTYSERCIELVKSYAREYPELFDKLAYTMNRDIFFEGDLWPDAVGQSKPQEVQKWLKSQAHTGAARRQCGSEALEPEEMKALWSDLEAQLKEVKTQKTVNLSVKWNVLYKPELHEGNIAPDSRADYKMYDRVVCVARNITVPLGTKGTITAIYQPTDGNTVRLSDKMNAQPTYQVMFDEPFAGAMSEDLFEEPRFYRMLPTNMLNISYGRQLRVAQTEHNVDTNSWGVTQPPAVLRRDNTHHSAFASYSPPREIKATTPDTNKSPDVANGGPKEDPTTLLRSLLKISENATDQTKQNKSKGEVNSNWRSKDKQTIIPQPKTQPPSWRKDNENPYRPPVPQSDWVNSNSTHYKNQPHAPPFVPFAPQYPQYRPRNNFPKHLPSVSNLLPSWTQNPPAPFQANTNQNPNSQSNQTNQPRTSQGANNPFVPLQVQTSQRRVHNVNQPPRNMESQPPAQSSLPKPQPIVPQPPQNNQPATTKTKKRKPRIAANLPFQFD